MSNGTSKHLVGVALALALAAAVGCGGSQKSGGAAKQSCATAAANARAQVKAAAIASGEEDAAAMSDQVGPLLERVMAERCAADAWPAAVIDCVATATDKTMEACTDQLTEAQRDAVGAQMDRELNAGAAESVAPGGGAGATGGSGDPCGGGEGADPCGGGE